VGISCASFEVNPFAHHVAVAKMRNSYRTSGFQETLRKVLKLARARRRKALPIPEMSTITKRGDLKKWLFAPESLQGILGLRVAFEEVQPLYRNLFLVVLSSVLNEIGNTTKDGKCVRYKRRWQDRHIDREKVIDSFEERASVFLEDIAFLEKRPHSLSNAQVCSKANVMEGLRRIPDRSVDAVITSPPYCNSFDYTDVYMPELWALGFVKSYSDVRRLRRKTFCSHVQVKWKFDKKSLPESISDIIASISEEALWNDTIPEMIRGYFIHMQGLLTELMRVTKRNARLCFVVGNSSYFNIHLPTDLLIASLAEKVGFSTEEIRVLRPFSKSTQQISTTSGRSITSLRESLVILRKP
jgi:hypothetical protein